MGLFYLSTLYCFIRSLDSPRPRAWHFALWTAGALALGSKEVAISLPLAVLLYDWLFVPGPRRARLEVHAVLWAIVLAGGIAVARARAVAFPEGGLTSWQYLTTQAGVIVRYLRLSFWPSPLVIDYYGWPPAENLVPVLLPALLIVALIAATAWALRTGSGLGFLGAIFFMVLAPTSSIVPLSNEIAAERRMYLPLAAVVTLVVLGVSEVIEALAKRVGHRRLANAVGLALLVPAALLLGAATVQRNADYRSAISIWTDAVTKRAGQRARTHEPGVRPGRGRAGGRSHRRVRAGPARRARLRDGAPQPGHRADAPRAGAGSDGPLERGAAPRLEVQGASSRSQSAPRHEKRAWSPARRPAQRRGDARLARAPTSQPPISPSHCSMRSRAS